MYVCMAVCVYVYIYVCMYVCHVYIGCDDGFALVALNLNTLYHFLAYCAVCVAFEYLPSS